MRSARKTHKGLFIYAVDGDQLDLPASSDVTSAGYRGYPCSKNRETHYPKMYTVQVLDLLNTVVHDFRYSHEQNEAHCARELALGFEKNSLAIYDRLHCGYPLFLAHAKAGNHFLVRARTNGRCSKVIDDFCASKKRAAKVLWRPNHHTQTSFAKGLENPPLWVRLIKVRNPRSKEVIVFVTNLPSTLFSHQEIAKLYQRRWDIETSFRDLTQTLKMNQWHSTKINGILQEIFALLWIVNQVRMYMTLMRHDGPSCFLKVDYKKSNFKLCLGLVMRHLELLIKRKFKALRSILEFWLRRTMEKRKHLARYYPRVVRHRGREYKHTNLVPRRSDALTERY